MATNAAGAMIANFSQIFDLSQILSEENQLIIRRSNLSAFTNSKFSKNWFIYQTEIFYLCQEHIWWDLYTEKKASVVNKPYT